MIHKLDVKERVVLAGVLPAEGDIVTLRIVRDLRTAISFTEEDIATVKMNQANGQVTWDGSVNLKKDVEIGTKGMSLIIDSLEKLEKSKRMNMDQLALYERFVLDKPDLKLESNV